MQRIIFVTFVLLLAFLNPAHSAVVPSYEGWEAAEEVQVRRLIGALLHQEALRPAHFASRTVTLKVVPSQIGPGSFYRADTLFIGTRPHAGTGNEWFDHSTVHEYSHALTDFSGDGYLQFPHEFYEALAETYTQYIAPKHLARLLKPTRSRLGGIRQNFNFLPEKPDLAFREAVWQQSQTHSCVAGDCESGYSELAFVLYQCVSAASIQLAKEDWEVFFMLTQSLHEQWLLEKKQRLHYPAIYEALNRAFPGVTIDGLSSGDWLATRRTFSQLKTGQLASIGATGSYWNGSTLFVGPFNPSIWTLRLMQGVAPRGVREPVRPALLTEGSYEVRIVNATSAIVFSEKVTLTLEDKGQVTRQMPSISDPGLYRIEAIEKDNRSSEKIAFGFFMVFNSLGDELVSSSIFVQSVSPEGTIVNQAPLVIGCANVWSVNGLTKLDGCESTVVVNGEEFSLDAKRRVLVTNGSNRWPVLKSNPNSILFTRAGESTAVSVYNANPQAQDTGFRTRVTHDSGSLDVSWCSTAQTDGQVIVAAQPTGGQFLRQCQVCLESNLGTSTPCIDVTYDPFN